MLIIPLANNSKHNNDGNHFPKTRFNILISYLKKQIRWDSEETTMHSWFTMQQLVVFLYSYIYIHTCNLIFLLMVTSSNQIKHLKALAKRFYPRRKTNHTNCTRLTIPISHNHKCVLTNTAIIIIIIIIVIIIIIIIYYLNRYTFVGRVTSSPFQNKYD